MFSLPRTDTKKATKHPRTDPMQPITKGTDTAPISSFAASLVREVTVDVLSSSSVCTVGESISSASDAGNSLVQHSSYK